MRQMTTGLLCKAQSETDLAPQGCIAGTEITADTVLPQPSISIAHFETNFASVGPKSKAVDRKSLSALKKRQIAP